MKLTELSVRRPVTTLMAFLAVSLLGLVSLRMLPVDLLPKMEPPAISVITNYPGASAEDVEDKVTRHIENQLSVVGNLETITSISAEGQSVVTCQFKWGTDLDEAANDIRDRLEVVKRLLPEDAERPMLFKFSTSMIPILFIGFTAEESYPRLYQFVDRFVANRIKTVPGVGSVGLVGGLEREIQVRLDRERLNAYGLTPAHIAQAIASSHFNLPAGRISLGKTEYVIRVLGEVEEPKEFERVVVDWRNGSPIYLRDVAEVRDTHKERRAYVRINGRDALMMMVQKQTGANTVEVSRRVKEKLKELSKNFPPDVEYMVLRDSGQDIMLSIRNLSSSLWWALMTVAAVVFFFLGRVIASFIIVLTIPFSLVVTFFLLYLLGMTINVISLSSVVISMGMVVDNAIVVLENITRKKQEGLGPTEASIEGTAEVGTAIMASSLTTIAVFLPLVFMKGLSGIMFKDMALVITSAILCSLLTALTVTPMLSSRLMRQREDKAFFTQRVIGALESLYSYLLERALTRPKVTIAISLGLLASTLFMFKYIGREFLPREDRSHVGIDVELPVGTRVEETDLVIKEIEKIIRQRVPEAEAVFVRCGSEEGGLSRAFGSKAGSHIGHIGIRLLEKGKRERSSFEIADLLRREIRAIPGVVKLTVMTEQPMARLLMGGSRALSLELMGDDLEELYRFSQELKRALEGIKGIRDVWVDYERYAPEVHVLIDKEKASALGLTVERIAQGLRSLFYGYEATRFLEAGGEYRVLLRLKELQRQDLKDIAEAPIALPRGGVIPLRNVAKVEVKQGPLEIYRKDQMRVIRVEANVYGRSLGEVAKEVDQTLKKLNPPMGVTVKWGGQVKEQQKSFRELTMLFLLGVVLVYMVMASQFESLRQPFVIMASVPFLSIGVGMALLLGKATMSMVSLIGMVMLVGIVVNNAIVLVDYTNLLRRKGMTVLQAVHQGGVRRLRPILMTALTTMGGVLPMVLRGGEGSESWRPLGLTVFGGLFSSTLITLFLVPLLYYLMERRRS